MKCSSVNAALCQLGVVTRMHAGTWLALVFDDVITSLVADFGGPVYLKKNRQNFSSDDVYTHFDSTGYLWKYRFFTWQFFRTFRNLLWGSVYWCCRSFSVSWCVSCIDSALLFQLGKVYGIESYVLSPAETKELYPLMNVEDLYGTLYVPKDGTMDPAGTCTTLSRAATARGATVQHNTSLLEITL